MRKRRTAPGAVVASVPEAVRLFRATLIETGGFRHFGPAGQLTRGYGNGLHLFVRTAMSGSAYAISVYRRAGGAVGVPVGFSVYTAPFGSDPSIIVELARAVVAWDRETWPIHPRFVTLRKVLTS